MRSLAESSEGIETLFSVRVHATLATLATLSAILVSRYDPRESAEKSNESSQFSWELLA